MLLMGDCLDELKKVSDESVDLVYMDPPFFTQATQTLSDKNGNSYKFKDKWKNISEYDFFLLLRIQECYKKLNSTGSIVVHCDSYASHKIRIILDSVFGYNNFRSEIIWTYKRWSNSRNDLLKSHQTLLVYSKTKDYKFNKIYMNYSETTNLDQLTQKRSRNSNNKSTYKKDENGNIIYSNEKKGVPMSDVWNIPFLNPKAKERVGYPTQKPLDLLERIIEIYSDKDDMVLDPFCGSGTTLVAAKRLGRKYIGIDSSKDAIEITKKRLNDPIKSTSMLLKKGRSSYNTKDKDQLSFLRSIKANPVYRNKGLDGLINSKNKLIAVKIQADEENISDALYFLNKAKNKRNITNGILFKTHDNTNDLFIDDYNGIDEKASSMNITIINSYNYIINNMFND